MKLESGPGHNSLNTLPICSKYPSLRRGRAIFPVWGLKYCKGEEGGLLISNGRLQEQHNGRDLSSGGDKYRSCQQNWYLF